MPFDFFNDVFLLHLPLEAPKGIFQRLALLQFYFSQPITPPIVFRNLSPSENVQKIPLANGEGILNLSGSRY